MYDPEDQLCLFVDYESKPADDIEQFTPDFQAPKNYKDKEAISKYIDEAAQKFLAEGGRLPFLCRLTVGAVVGADGSLLMHGDAKSLLQYFDGLRSTKQRILLIGFEPGRFWSCLAATLAMDGLVSSKRRLPSQLFDYRNHRGLDETFGVSANVPRSTVLKRLLPDASGIGDTAVKRAKTAWRLAAKLQCFPGLHTEVLPFDIPAKQNPDSPVKAKKTDKPLKKLKPLKPLKKLK